MGFHGVSGSGTRRVRCARQLVEPGYALTTRFAQNVDVRVEDLIPEAYAAFAAPIFGAFAEPAPVTTEGDVAEAVWLCQRSSLPTMRQQNGDQPRLPAKRSVTGPLSAYLCGNRRTSVPRSRCGSAWGTAINVPPKPSSAARHIASGSSNPIVPFNVAGIAAPLRASSMR